MGDDPRDAGPGLDWQELARQARPREVTGATFSYVDAMLTGRMSEADLARIRDDILGPSDAPVDPKTHVQALIGARDYTQGLVEAERILAADPTDAQARRLAEECRGRLADQYQASLGSPRDVPVLGVEPASLSLHRLDRWSAHLLAHVDGRTSIDDLAAATGYTRLDTLRLLYELVQRGLVRLREAPPRDQAGGAVLARIELRRGRKTD